MSFFSMFRHVLRAVGVAAALAATASSWGQISISDSEKALLPDYCKFAQTGDFGNELYHAPSDGMKKLIARNGENQWNMHHYCKGLVYFARSRKGGIPAAEKKKQLEQFVLECDYMINNATGTFPLLPEIWTNRGVAQATLSLYSNAITSFDRAIAISPTFVRAYAQKAEVFVKKGDMAQMRAVIAAARTAGVSSPHLDELAKLK